MIDAELEADHAAHRQPDVVHRAEVQVLDQRQHIGTETGDAVALARFVRTPVAADVRDDHAVVRGQGRDLHFPVQCARTEPVNQ
ncbi:hypothetical protein D3C81_1548090 [compost metagenome]